MAVEKVLNVDTLCALTNSEFNEFMKRMESSSLETMFRLEDLYACYDVDSLKGHGVLDVDDVLLPSAEMLQLDVDEHLPRYNRDRILDYEVQIQINKYARDFLKGMIEKGVNDASIKLLYLPINPKGEIDDYENQVILNEKIKSITEILIDRYIETKSPSAYESIISFDSGSNDILKAKEPVFDSESMAEFHDILAKIDRAILLSKYNLKLARQRKLIEPAKEREGVSGLDREGLLEKIERLVRLSQNEKANAFENRDFFLESDQRLGGAHAMRYNKIYQLSNVFPGTIENVRCLANIIQDLRAFSHLNGAYENSEKERFIRELDRRIQFRGIRFHDYEHEEFIKKLKEDRNLGKKDIRYQRPRNNKALTFKKEFNIEDLSSYFIIDDSLDNLRAWRDAGGVAIFFNRAGKKQDRANGDNFIEVTSLEPTRVILALIKANVIKVRQKTRTIPVAQ